MSRETVSNYMRLLRLPQKVMEYMLSERLSFSDAREILRLENDEYIEAGGGRSGDAQVEMGSD